MPGGSAPYQPGRTGKPNRPGISGIWPTLSSIRSGRVSGLKLALAIGVVLVVCIVVFDRLTASSPPSTPGAQVQTTGTPGPSSQGSTTGSQPPQVQTSGSPVASFTVPGLADETAASGTLQLGKPEPARSYLTQSASSQAPCSAVDPTQAVAVPFEITLKLGSGEPSGDVSLTASLTWPQSSTPPAADKYPVQITASGSSEGCASGTVAGFGNGWSSQTVESMNPGTQETVAGWFVFPLVASTSDPDGNRSEMAFYDLLISVSLPGAGNSDLSAYGPNVCQRYYIQLVGQLNQQNGCGQFLTPSATPSS